MAYERYGRGDGDYRRDQGQDGRDYHGAGDLGGYDRDGNRGYGSERDYGRGNWGQGGSSQRDYVLRDNGGREYGSSGYGQRDYASSTFAKGDYGRQRGGWDSQDRYRDRFTGGDDYYRPDEGRDTDRQSRQQQDYRQSGQGNQGGGRGFVERAGDEVRSWFGDEQAERRREQDARDAERGSYGRDEHYHDWRDQQVAGFDRDYAEYRHENRQKFHNEFSSWRTERQGQRDLLPKVTEHLEVVGSDGEHVGTVDKVRGDRVILTKSDADAGGRHHSFPSRWIQSVDGKVTLTKTAAEAKRQWQDEERQGAMFGSERNADGNGQTAGQTGATDLNRSFSGTY